MRTLIRFGANRDVLILALNFMERLFPCLFIFAYEVMLATVFSNIFVDNEATHKMKSYKSVSV